MRRDDPQDNPCGSRTSAVYLPRSVQTYRAEFNLRERGCVGVNVRGRIGSKGLRLCVDQ